MNSAATQILLPAAIGGLTGGGLAIMLSAGPEEVPAEPVAKVVLAAPLPADCPARKDALTDERARLERALSAVELQLKITEHRRIAREGVEAPWPDAPDPLQVPETYKAKLTAALAEVDGEVLEMECDEYPCIVAVVLPKLDDVNGVSGDATTPMYDALNDHGYVDHELQFATTTSVGDDYVSVFAIRGPQEEAIDNKRTRFRGKRFAKETFERMREVEVEP